MKAQVLLRIASVLAMIHAILHTIGGVFGKPPSAAASAVATQMQSTRFLVYGVTRSYSDFYTGMGVSVSLFLVISAVLLWQVGSLVREHGKQIRPLLVAAALLFVLLAVDSYRYFFFGPVVAEILIALFITAAMVTSKYDRGAMAER